jgi:hypothetical protein
MKHQSVLANLPDHSRVWIYTASRKFTDSETALIQTAAKEFVRNWKAHGAALEADIEVVSNQFLVVGVNEQVAGVTGCGIDSSVAFIKQTEQQMNVVLLDRLNLAYRQPNNEIHVLPMSEFMAKFTAGEITEDTPVFDNTVQNLGELRQRWEVPMKNSWHKQLV